MKKKEDMGETGAHGLMSSAIKRNMIAKNITDKTILLDPQGDYTKAKASGGRLCIWRKPL
jgi:hypothetical protein